MIPSISAILRRLRGAHLTLLVALDETGSLSRSAERVGISQPAATKALREIEGIFGTRLFERSTKGIEPNDMGRSIVRSARRLRAELIAVRNELTHMLNGGGVRLSVGAVMGAITGVVISAIAELHRQYPNLFVEFIEGTSGELLQMLDQRRIDVAIARPSVSTHPEAYTFEPLNSEYLLLVVGPKGPLTKRKSLKLEELVECRWLVFPSQMPMRNLLEEAFFNAGLEFPTNVIETDSTFATTTFLGEYGDLVAVMPNSVADYMSARKLVHILPVSIPRHAEPYGIVMRSDSPISPVMQVFADACARAIQTV
ncbi:MAG: LysR family transcriptional regulator [Burkholderiaceae bacterium]